MIDLAVPTDTLALFNLRQYFKKNSKETFKYIFFDNFEYIHNLYLSGKLRVVNCVILLLIIFKKLFFAPLFI